MTSHPMRLLPIRSARFTMPPPLWRAARRIAAPPATPGPGQTPAAPAPPPSRPDGMPPEIQDPTPPESPVPVREPPAMPPPMGLTLRALSPDAFRTTKWTKCSLRTASEDSTNG